jgi:hypothetical protein
MGRRVVVVPVTVIILRRLASDLHQCYFMF